MTDTTRVVTLEESDMLRALRPVNCPALIKKLAEVMGEVERVAKHGRNDFHKYDYATESDISAAVRAGMASRGLMLIPDVRELRWRETEKGTPIATLFVQFTVTDGEQAWSFTMVGEGQDSGDKAVYKALTGATKYAEMKLFLIPTGDDPEKDAPPPSRPAQKGGQPQQAHREPKESSPAPPVTHEPAAPQIGISQASPMTIQAMIHKIRDPKPTEICPKCGKPAIIKGRAEWGGGWVCFKKKGGCGAKWAAGAAEIEQPGADLSDPETHRRESENLLPSPDTTRQKLIERIKVFTDARVMSYRHKFDLGDSGHAGLEERTDNELEMLARHLEMQ